MEVTLIDEPTHSTAAPVWCKRCKVMHEWCPVLVISDDDIRIICPVTRDVIEETYLVADFRPLFHPPCADQVEPPDPECEPFESRLPVEPIDAQEVLTHMAIALLLFVIGTVFVIVAGRQLGGYFRGYSHGEKPPSTVRPGDYRAP